MSITLREEVPEDEPHLFALFAGTRADEMATVPWTVEQKLSFLQMQFDAQRSFYKEKYSSATYHVIMEDNVAVGRLYVAREKELIRILDITLVPEKRSEGIGTHLIKQLLNEGADTQRPVQIYVETFNRSLGLFERLGFSRRAEEGFNYLLEWAAETT
jgi:N-acetylglutamate synthase-like GNAT family acetyltransferase